MKFDHIGFYCQGPQAEGHIKMILGLQNLSWVKDTVTALSEVRGFKPLMHTVDTLRCDSMGIGVKLIRYTNGHYWCENDLSGTPTNVPVISHLGFLLRDDQDVPRWARQFWKKVQETYTKQHSNPAEQFNYVEHIYDTGNRSYINFIRRVKR